ncbi:MAG: Endoglucanase H precursor [Pelotomaculum sp. PtaU1.Bin035]|nr:MAG: Endoglucanase H precursor [Pelotomaculum sp. PtaU1.Bin035]
MRLVISLLLAIGLVFFAAGPNTAMAGQEWQLYNEAESMEKAGDLEGAMTLWESLVEAMAAIGEDEAAGFCAQKLGRALDKQGRYAEAVKYFKLEAGFWNKLPGHDGWSLYDTRRAEEIRPEIQVFVEEDATEAPGPALAKHEPAWGTLLGAAVAGDPAIGYGNLDQIPSVYGRNYASLLVYVNEWNTYPDETFLRIAKEDGYSLQVAWEPSYGLSAVEDNDYLRSFAGILQDYGLPVFLRFAAEMNGDWTPWSGNPELYIEKFRLVAGVMRQEAPNVAMVWSPGYYPEEKVDAYYPGDRWVDWVGINAYSDYYFNGLPDSPASTATVNYQGINANPLRKFKAIYDRYSPSKPIMISETGVAWANRYPFVDVSEWGAANLERFYSYLPLIYPRIKAVYYFNFDISNKGREFPCPSHYLISGNKEMLRAYRQATASPWYLEDWSQTSPVYYCLPPDNNLPPGAKSLVSYVNTGNGVSRVEYYFNGNMIGSAGAPPWNLNFSFDQAGPGTLEVRAYDKYGNLGATRVLDLPGNCDNQSPGELLTGDQAVSEILPISVMLDGAVLDFDVDPIEMEGRVLVPVRAILEALGVQVDWEEATRTVVARKGSNVLRLQIDNLVPALNGSPLPPLDVPARVVNGRTMVPVRFISENYGAKVGWDGDARTVIISSSD